MVNGQSSLVNILVLVGPTGVGKTELSLRLAEHYGCPILNADSRQIYRDLPIGTAAPTKEEQNRVKHYFVGTKGLEETYNAGQFARDVQKTLDSLALSEPSERFGERVSRRDGKGALMALLTGGSMMYIDAVCNGLDDIPEVPSDVRERVHTEYKEKGLGWLQAEVARLDPDYWKEVDRQNPQRLLHCLEVTWASGNPYSTYRTSPHPLLKRGTSSLEGRFGRVIVGLNRPREELYARINARVDRMIADGLEEEARAAYGKLAAPTVGYRELFDYFDGKISRDEAIRLIKQNSRHYAKRQMTWWRRQTDIHWLDATLDYETQITAIDTLLGATDVLHQE